MYTEAKPRDFFPGGLPFDLREIRDPIDRRSYLIEQAQPVAPHRRVVGIHRDLIEERVHRPAQFGEGGHGGGKVFLRDSPPGFSRGLSNRIIQRALLALREQVRVDGAGIFDVGAVLFSPRRVGY